MSEQISIPGARQWLAGRWLGFGAMDSVTEINAQCLELLCSTAASSVQPLPGMLANHLPQWLRLSPAGREQLAASPYLLVDAGFDDDQRWQPSGRRMVRDLRRDLSAPFFVGEQVCDFVRRVLMFGWHLARANRQLARVVLGMTPTCATHVAALQLRDLDWLAQTPARLGAAAMGAASGHLAAPAARRRRRGRRAGLRRPACVDYSCWRAECCRRSAERNVRPDVSSWICPDVGVR